MAASRKPGRKKSTAPAGKKRKTSAARAAASGASRARKKKTAVSRKKAAATGAGRKKKKTAGRAAGKKSTRKQATRKKALPRVVPTGRFRTDRPDTQSAPSAPPDQWPQDPDLDARRPGESPDAHADSALAHGGENHQAHDDQEYEQPGYDHLPDPYEQEQEDRDAYMSVGDHLEELRVRIFWMIGVIAGLAGVAGFFSGTLHDYLVMPYAALTDQNLILQNVYGPMEIFIKVSVLAAVIVGFPALVYILWGFVTPAVSRRTALYGHLAVAASALLFWTGIAVCWLYIVPLSLRFFFVGMQMDGVDPILSVERYYGFLFALHLATGLAFQLPIVLIALGAFGILTVAWHKRTWRFALVIIYISSAIITPPDPWSMLGVGTLLALLYVLSIGVVWLIERGRRERS